MKKMMGVLILMLAVTFLFAGCSSKDDGSKAIVGKWMSDLNQQTIEFTAEGLYKSAGQSKYTYEILKGKQIKIVNPESTDAGDTIVMDFVIKDNVMTTTYDGSSITWNKK
jgi:ABC-type glycerol-3-phosphate transport system substrate-binding protein